MKLGQIAQVRIGLVLTRKKATIKYEIKDTYKLVTLKNINNSGEFNEEPFEIFESNDKLDEGYFTREGDILVRLNHPYTAVYIDKDKTNLLVPSYFSIIRLKTPRYIPQYVTWYLNTDRVERELIRSQTGTAALTTNKTVLASICIKEISVKDQKRIAKVQELYLKEACLLKMLIKEKEKYYKAMTNKLLDRN